MALDETWVLSCAFFSILGLLGYSMIAAGAVRYKSVQSAIITILLGGILTILAFYITGYAFAFGQDSNKFIGKSLFAAASFESTPSKNDYDNFVFHTIAAIFVTSIFALGTLERSRFFSFSFGVIILQGLLYPIVVHWTFGQGWLSTFGFQDFGGSSVIHVFGGVTALLASLLLHERRDQNGKIHPGIFPHHAPFFVGIGTILLVVVQIIFLSGLNRGSATYVKGLVPVNALLAASFGGLSSYVSYYLKKEKTSLITIARGSLAGVVAVSASVDDIQLWAAAFIGTLAGISYLVIQLIVKRSHVDDPGQAVGAHLVPGILGTLLYGILSRSHGLFYGNNLKSFGIQIVGVLSIAGWALLILAVLVPLKGFGIFKIKPEQESLGIDQSYAGGEAYVFSDQTVETKSLLNSQKKSIFH
ncbi:unnamed protein product (macronuclear) [Paramecium tetraurelia]|uniref:Ammonium transporter AmtB-like domain-containing protein n=1 Tax=Paramecium tetraurelia TaxID=5888 RepID=A0E7D8_PARTE|nr:uncharacterized protein GSPATT00023933001 [Paramecium tetraurelia]CAK91205.1 unnamed protein product [Paramecium tetraurelia]|eukprot:XP_001458602.1 hypothetical protein (macronuclear) [Paramecium tetraurelia strain d4-2]